MMNGMKVKSSFNTGYKALVSRIGGTRMVEGVIAQNSFPIWIRNIFPEGLLVSEHTLVPLIAFKQNILAAISNACVASTG